MPSCLWTHLDPCLSPSNPTSSYTLHSGGTCTARWREGLPPEARGTSAGALGRGPGLGAEWSFRKCICLAASGLSGSTTVLSLPARLPDKYFFFLY